MQIKSQVLKIKGMNKDLSYSSYSPEFSYDNKNVRVVSVDSNNLLSITNERGNVELVSTDETIIEGNVIGSCNVGELFIIFTTNGNGVDKIYRIKDFNKTNNTCLIELYFSGDLGFNLNNRIQSLPFYENDSFQKVYWLDGINQPRYLNAAVIPSSTNNDQFDFVKDLSLGESVTITKNSFGGFFKAGVVQYAFTYFSLNGAETNIFHLSPLYYSSFDDRAGKVDEIVPNSFTISLSGLDTNFDFVRVYSIFRTSLDTTPEVKNVVDLNISGGTASYVDTNTAGSIVSSDVLLYVGGESIIPQCMSQKNNTLFFGNIEIDKGSTPPIRIDKSAGTFEWKRVADIDAIDLENNLSNQSYSYLPSSLSKNSNNIKHFKFKEKYRFGIQGQYSNGRWSTPIYIGDDYEVGKRYKTFYKDNNFDTIKIAKVYGEYTILDGSQLKSDLLNLGFKSVRPVMVPLDIGDRHIVAQGIVNNTLGTVENRKKGKVSGLQFAYPDYLFRPHGKSFNVQGYASNGLYRHFDLLRLNNNVKSTVNNETDSFWGETADAPPYIEIMANVYPWDPIITRNPTHVNSGNINWDDDLDILLVDQNLVNFWSPDLIYNYSNIQSAIKACDVASLYGFACITSDNFEFKIDLSDNGLVTKWNSHENNSNYSHSSSQLYSGCCRIVYTQLPGFPDQTEPDPNKHYNEYHSIPMWSPEHYRIGTHQKTQWYHNGITDIQFTNLSKRGFVYFGLNYNLDDDGEVYKYSINNPSILYNDSTTFYKTNIVDSPDNGGNIIYSKYVEKTYPTGSYSNCFRWNQNVIGADQPSKDLQYGSVVEQSESKNYSVETGMSLKYNTNTHGLFSFKQNSDGRYVCMPRIRYGNIDTSDSYERINRNSNFTDDTNQYQIDIINGSNLNGYVNDTNMNTLPVFDLIRTVSNQYGGDSDSALQNNTWIPCGESVKIDTGDIVLQYTEGDTYIQRFDMLRVFPNDILQINQHTEIVSFICESFINLDGRSDINRYNTDSSLMTTSNYGILNPVYSQNNNYFSYNILNSNLFKSNKFFNTVVWSGIKQSGELVDTWTNVNMTNSLDVDGIYGEISSINLYNNDLFVFQPKSISRLLYKERVQAPASDKISITLTTGYNTPDYRYLSNQYGCSDKFSIVEGKGGIYFIDQINKAFVSVGEGIKDLSSSLGFKSWFYNEVPNEEFTLSYDRILNDVYIHNDSYCLGFSETTQTFTSFYDYMTDLQMRNIWNNFVTIKNNGVWVSRVGEYNNFYGALRSFWVEYIVNQDPLNDKVFDRFEYTLDNDNINWNKVDVSNYYQNGVINTNEYNTKVVKKFNVYRGHIPRAIVNNVNSLNRIRSTWAKFKMTYVPDISNNNNKLAMQNVSVIYTV